MNNKERAKLQTKNNLAIASMVVGIISIVSFFIPFWGIIDGIVGIILSTLSLKSEKAGFAITGLITSIAGAVLAGISSFCFLLFFDEYTSFEKERYVSPYCDEAYYCSTDCSGGYCKCYYLDDYYDDQVVYCPSDYNRL